MTTTKATARNRRHKRIRAKISGTSECPRISVFKSNTLMYAQLIDDDKGVTLASAKGGSAEEVGKQLGEQAKAKKVGRAVFDRGGYIYTGKVKALADALRKTGLKF